MPYMPEPERYCSARNRAGTRCRRRVRDGTLVCGHHGGKAPQTARKAEARREAAKIRGRDLTPEERRDPWVIMIDAVQRLDSIMTSGELEGSAFVEHAERLIKSAKLLIDSGAAERLVRVAERRTAEDAQVVLRISQAVVGAAVQLVAEAGAGAAQCEATRVYLLGILHRELAEFAAELSDQPQTVEPLPPRPVLRIGTTPALTCPPGQDHDRADAIRRADLAILGETTTGPRRGPRHLRVEDQEPEAEPAEDEDGAEAGAEVVEPEVVADNPGADLPPELWQRVRGRDAAWGAAMPPPRRD